MRSTLAARCRLLAVLELLNIVLLPLTFFWAVGVPATVANLVGYGLVALLLLQGAGYWFVKREQIVRHRPHPRGLRVFARLRRVDVVALAVGLVVVAVASLSRPGLGSWPGFAFWALALAEYVNYFHIQLTHDNAADVRRLLRTRRLHPSHLSADLAWLRRPTRSNRPVRRA